MEVNRSGKREKPKVSQALDNEEVMVRYLLGELSEEEGAQLEDEYFARDDFFEQLLAAEDDLIDSYVCGELSANKRARFEKHFLSTPRRRERVEFARGLIKSVARTGTPVAAPSFPATQESFSWWKSLSPAFSFARHRPAGFAFAASVIVLALTGMWIALERRAQQRARMERLGSEQKISRPEQQTTAPHRQNNNQPDERPAIAPEATVVPPSEERTAFSEPTPRNAGPISPTPPRRPAIVSLVLSPDLVRGAGEANRLVIPLGTSLVRLRLTLKADDSYRSYRASLQTIEGKDTWGRRALSALPSRSGVKALTLQLPARLLPTGDYILTLSGVTADGSVESVAEYYLKVEKE